MKKVYSLTLSILVLSVLTSQAQNVFDINDKDSIFSSQPPAPPYGRIAKWGHAVRLTWGGTGTTTFKSYYFNGMAFRLKFPKSYQQGVSDGKLYPVRIFLHGAGEAGNIWDNEYQMFWGGKQFRDSVDSGAWDGFLFYEQSTNGYHSYYFPMITNMMDSLGKYCKLDENRIVVDGLSSGGQGVWDFLGAYPKYIASALPISAARADYYPTIPNYVHIPIWLFHGGLDNNPAPAEAAALIDTIRKSGGNIAENFYPTLGHGVWPNAWVDPGYIPFMKAAYKSNPLCYFLKTNFCPGQPITARLGLTAGFFAYQWMKDGSVISGAASNTITVNQLGTYSARFQRTSSSAWSDWSRIPITLTINSVGSSPTILINGMKSDWVPSPDSSKTVPLMEPAGFTSYKWVRVSDSAIVGTQNIYNASPGTYVVQATPFNACSSTYSPSFTVVNAKGPNPPDPASNLTANTVSQTAVQLVWSQNPHPTINETGFEIYRATTSGGPYSLVATNAKDSVNYLDQGLGSNTNYYYIVRAVGSTAAASVTNEASAKTTVDNSPPTAPANLAVIGTSSTSVSLQWSASTDNVGVTYYDIYINGVKAYSTPSINLNFTVNNLTHDQTYNFVVKARDLVSNISPASNQVTASAVYSGLAYKYFTGSWSVLPNFNGLLPVSVGTMNNISLALASQPTNYGYLWQGYLNIRTAGTYTLEISSDDGSDLYLGSNGSTNSAYNPPAAPLINNDGLHGTQSRTASIALSPGLYPIAISYFQAGGGASLQLLWTCTTAGISRSLIPDSAFNEKITLAGAAPAAPSSLTATALAYNRVNLAWTYNTNNGNNPTGFQIFRSSNNSALTPIGSTSASTFAFQDTVVSAATTYNYAIQADGQYGQSGFYPTQGVSYSYYQTGSLTSLPNFNTLTPVSTGVVSNFVLGMQTQANNFAVKYDGYINIIQGGSYTFTTQSDDGSALYIGGYSPGNLVVNNDGLHGMVAVTGSTILNPGIYPITVVYFQAGGGAGLNVSYNGPGVSNQIIPNKVLSRFVSATTLAPPPPPQAPTGLKATALSSSSIGLAWNDNAGDAAGFQINRSTGDKLSYRVIATLPNNGGSSFSYMDSSLFDNVVYFYKVNGVGPGGSGTASNYDSAKTPLNNPVITPVPNFTMRYGTSDTVSLKVTDKDGVPVTISAINLPAFGTIRDNGNGTGTLIFNPATSDAGTYNGIVVMALASNGGIGKDTFNLVVNNNYPPVLNPISDASFNEGTKDTILLRATDQNGVAGLVFSSSNLPSFGNIVNNNDGTASLFLNPTYISHGTYSNITITVTDPQGGTSIKSFNLTIVQKNPNQQILVRMRNQYSVALPWNNMTSPQLNNLVATDGTTTGVSVSLAPSSWWNTYNQGPSTGNNSGVYKDSVLREYYYFGIFGGPNTVTDTISGLKPSKKYNLRFYGGSSWTGVSDNGTTIYTIGSQSDSLNVQNNTSRTADFNGVTADNTGRIVVTMNKMGTTPVGYLNAFEIDYVFDDSTAPAPPTNLTASLLSGKGVQLNWTDVAYNAQRYNVYRTRDTTVAFTLLNPGANNANATSYIDSTVSGHTTYYYKLKAVNNYGDLGFTNTVSIATAAKNPTVSGISNTTVKINSTGNIAFSATDDPGDAVTVTDTLPSFAVLQNLGNGNYNIMITPNSGNIGSYYGSVTATDSYGAATTTGFQIFVVESNVASVYVHFGTDSSSVPAPWNNFIGYPFAGRSLSGLLRADGTNSGITMTLVDQWSNPPVDFGMVTGDNSGLFPDVVNRSSLFEATSSPRRIQLSGLDPSKFYNVVVFSSANTGQTSGATVVLGTQSVHLNASYNTNKTLQFNGLQAPTGTLTLSYTKDASAPYGYFNAIIIQSYDTSVVHIVSPNFVYAEPLFNSRTSLKLNWADRSNNETGFEIWRSTSANGSYSLVQTVAANSTSYTDQGLIPNTQYFYQVRAVNGIAQSDYSIIASAITPSSIVLEHLTWHFPEILNTWNNTAVNPQVGDRYANLTNDQLSNTGIALNVLAGFGGEFNGGMISGNNSYVFPDTVMESMFWVQKGSQIAVLSLDGLDQTKKYRIGFEGSATWNQDMTSYMTINGVTKYQNSDSNKTSIVYFNGVIPDINGQVQMTFGAKGQYGLLGALVLMSYTDNGNSGVPVNIPHPDSSGTGANGTQTAESAITDELQHFRAYPNPFRQGFSISFDNLTSGKKIDIEVYSLEGKLIYLQEGGYTYAGTNTHEVYLPSTTAPGMYLARVKIDGKPAKLFKLIKTR